MNNTGMMNHTRQGNIIKKNPLGDFLKQLNCYQSPLEYLASNIRTPFPVVQGAEVMFRPIFSSVVLHSIDADPHGMKNKQIHSEVQQLLYSLLVYMISRPEGNDISQNMLDTFLNKKFLSIQSYHYLTSVLLTRQVERGDYSVDRDKVLLYQLAKSSKFHDLMRDVICSGNKGVVERWKNIPFEKQAVEGFVDSWMQQYHLYHLLGQGKNTTRLMASFECLLVLISNSRFGHDILRAKFLHAQILTLSLGQEEVSNSELRKNVKSNMIRYFGEGYADRLFLDMIAGSKKLKMNIVQREVQTIADILNYPEWMDFCEFTQDEQNLLIRKMIEVSLGYLYASDTEKAIPDTEADGSRLVNFLSSKQWIPKATIDNILANINTGQSMVLSRKNTGTREVPGRKNIRAISLTSEGEFMEEIHTMVPGFFAYFQQKYPDLRSETGNRDRHKYMLDECIILLCQKSRLTWYDTVMKIGALIQYAGKIPLFANTICQLDGVIPAIQHAYEQLWGELGEKQSSLSIERMKEYLTLIVSFRKMGGNKDYMPDTEHLSYILYERIMSSNEPSKIWVEMGKTFLVRLGVSENCMSYFVDQMVLAMSLHNETIINELSNKLQVCIQSLNTGTSAVIHGVSTRVNELQRTSKILPKPVQPKTSLWAKFGKFVGAIGAGVLIIAS